MLFFGFGANAQQLTNYDVKENLLKNSKLAVIACDTANVPLEQINGDYLFTINGFEQHLKFSDGVAIVPLKIDKSTFVFFKHHNELGNHNKLFFVKKSEKGLNPIKINVLWLILAPIAIVLIISAVRKYLWIGILLLIAYFYLGHSNGLSVGTFLDSLFSQLQALVSG